MSLIEDFFSEGIADQIAVMGTVVVLRSMPSRKESNPFKAIITSRDGTLQAEYGGALYSVTGHILIPTNTGITPRVSDQIISNGKEWFISSVVRSVIDKAYSCDLIKIN